MAEAKKQKAPAAAGEAVQVGEFDTLLRKEFKPKTDRAREAVESAVKTLAEQALSQTALISDDAVKTVEAIIAELDKKLGEQVNAIIHHADFQKLESTWSTTPRRTKR